MSSISDVSPVFVRLTEHKRIINQVRFLKSYLDLHSRGQLCDNWSLPVLPLSRESRSTQPKTAWRRVQNHWFDLFILTNHNLNSCTALWNLHIPLLWLVHSNNTIQWFRTLALRLSRCLLAYWKCRWRHERPSLLCSALLLLFIQNNFVYKNKLY